MWVEVWSSIMWRKKGLLIVYEYPGGKAGGDEFKEVPEPSS
jgi:hypothetical protein